MVSNRSSVMHHSHIDKCAPNLQWCSLDMCRFSRVDTPDLFFSPLGKQLKLLGILVSHKPSSPPPPRRTQN